MQSRRQRCGAKTRSGEPCKTWAMPNGRCRMHGGKSLSGVAHPNYRHGGYSKDLPARLLPRYEAVLANPEILSLDTEIALSEARISELLQQLDLGGLGQRWQELVGLREQVRIAYQAGDQEEVDRIVNRTFAVIGAGADDTEIWQELRAEREQKRRLIESERKRRVEMQLLVRVEQALVFADAVMHAVRGAVIEHHRDDPDVARAILASAQRAFAEVVGLPVPGGV